MEMAPRAPMPAEFPMEMAPRAPMHAEFPMEMACRAPMPAEYQTATAPHAPTNVEFPMEMAPRAPMPAEFPMEMAHRVPMPAEFPMEMAPRAMSMLVMPILAKTVGRAQMRQAALLMPAAGAVLAATDSLATTAKQRLKQRQKPKKLMLVSPILAKTMGLAQT